jgi:hypothetical protein
VRLANSTKTISLTWWEKPPALKVLQKGRWFIMATGSYSPSRNRDDDIIGLLSVYEYTLLPASSTRERDGGSSMKTSRKASFEEDDLDEEEEEDFEGDEEDEEDEDLL